MSRVSSMGEAGEDAAGEDAAGEFLRAQLRRLSA